MYALCSPFLINVYNFVISFMHNLMAGLNKKSPDSSGLFL
jgi:hypothetical protein